MNLYYFDCYGRAEPIRMLLNHAKIQFKDNQFNHKEFQKIKEKGIFEFGQVPVLEMNGKVYSQSISILRMLGMMHGYYPKDPEQAWKVESTIDANRDLQEKFWHVFLEKDKQKKEELLNEYIQKQLPFYFTVMQKRLKENSNQQYFVGNSLTIADFDNAHVAYDYFKNPKNAFHKEQSEVLNNFKDLDKYYEGLHDGELKEHFQNRPPNKPF